MYNSENLPLEPRKVIKKSLGSVITSFFVSLLFAVFVFIGITSLKINSDTAAMYSVLAFVIVNLLFGGLVLLYQYLYYRFYYYNFEEDKAEIRKGVVSVSTGHVRYSRIQDIYVDQDILDRVMGLYDVHYETAGETSGFYSHVDGLNKENSEKLVAFLNERVMRKDSNGTKAENIETRKEVSGGVENDGRIYSRENVAVDRNIVWLGALNSTWYLTFGGFVLSFLVFSEMKSVIDLSFGFFLKYALSIVAISFAASYAYSRVWYKNFYFKFDGKSGEIRTKVLSVSSTFLYYDRIQNIDLSQSFLERILGMTRLVIETASEGTSMHAASIPGLKKESAQELKDFLMQKSQKYRPL